MLEVLRYPKPFTGALEVDGHRNLLGVTAMSGLPALLLESGINAPASTHAAEGHRRAAILIRSSPWKAGSISTPWHDVFDLDNGHVRYFGDHKASSTQPLGGTRGNKLLLSAFAAHSSASSAERLQAPPLVLFRAVRVGEVVKGYVEFAGIAVIERVEQVVQWDDHLRQSYPNYVYDLAVLDLGAENERLDWNWINARRNPKLEAAAALQLAPKSWKRWAKDGTRALPLVRRKVSRARIMSKADQRPPIGSKEEKVLTQTYDAFAVHKHHFEAVAASVAARVFRASGSVYHEGWLTQPSGDKGVDFVGRVDLGSGLAQTRLVVLGQAKCVAPSTSISADQIARVVARLRRGWVGVYVTTGVFSEPAQQEIGDDEYPIVLIHGARLATEIRQMALETHEGDVPGLLQHLVQTGVPTITHRLPEEILFT
jgi:hypothetical protein